MKNVKKSERSVWKTEQNLVWISDVRISDIWAVRFVRSFGYTINVRNPNVRLVELINRLSEIQTVWEWDNFGMRWNTNVRISDVYCNWKTLCQCTVNVWNLDVWSSNFCVSGFQEHEMSKIKTKFDISEITQKCLKCEQKFRILDTFWIKLCVKDKLLEN